jgi:hypothetical protein
MKFISLLILIVVLPIYALVIGPFYLAGEIIDRIARRCPCSPAADGEAGAGRHIPNHVDPPAQIHTNGENYGYAEISWNS